MENKPYLSLNDYLREKFHEKTAKLSIDGGFSCPNRDGTLSFGGCIFCSEHGAGDFTFQGESITQKLLHAKQQINHKWNTNSYIAYFQAFSNTYAPSAVLRERYNEAIKFPQVRGLAIATRPDCINEDVIAVLKEFRQKTYLWVELGFQTSKERTAQIINRGYTNAVFESAVESLHKAGIETVVHIIFGLPGETRKDMLQTVEYISTMPIKGVKFHLLHILKNTPLEKYYEKHPFPLLEKDEYIALLAEAIKRIPKDVVIHRLTGDGSKNSLIAPLWSLNKRDVLNSFHKYLRENHIQQGQCCPR